MSAVRTVRRMEAGIMVPCAFEDLQVGEVFELREPDGDLVTAEGCHLFIAKELPFKNERGFGVIECDPWGNEGEPIAVANKPKTPMEGAAA